MKFAKILEDEAIPEWRPKFVRYKFLKKKLKEIHDALLVLQQQQQEQLGLTPWSTITGGNTPRLSKQTSSDGMSTDLSQGWLAQVANTSESAFESLEEFEAHLSTKIPEEQSFFAKFKQEVEKADDFYKLKLIDARGKLLQLITQVEYLKKVSHTVSETREDPCVPENNLMDDLEAGTCTATSDDHATPDKVMITSPQSGSEKGPDVIPIAEPHPLVSSRPASTSLPLLTEATHEPLPKSTRGHHVSAVNQLWKHTRQAVKTPFTREKYDIAHDSRHAKGHLQRAIKEFYRELDLLRNYKILNYTACVKILKKHDKLSNWVCKSSAMNVLVESRYFVQSKDLDALISRTEHLFASLMGYSRKVAMKKLRIPDLQHKVDHFVAFRLGLYFGLSIPAFIFVLVYVGTYFSTLPSFSLIAQMYGGILILLVFIILFGLNIYVWRRVKINYVFIFEFNPRNYLTFYEYFELVGLLTVLWCYSAFFYVIQLFLPLYQFPLLMGVYGLFLFNPFDFAYRSARFWLLRVLFRILFSPLFRVEFRDFFVADQLNSLIYTLVTAQRFVCFYSAGPQRALVECGWETNIPAMFLAMLPAWWRFAQCLRRYFNTGQKWPHLANAGKYFFTLLITLFSGLVRFSQRKLVFRVLWIVCAAIGTPYAYVWDVKMDWGLFQRKSEHRFLRDELMYPWTWSYYFAIVSNFVLRLSWIITISPNAWGVILNNDILLFVLSFVEAFRRFQWNFFRLENEHANNCGNFRAVKEIPLPFQFEEGLRARKRERRENSHSAEITPGETPLDSDLDQRTSEMDHREGSMEDPFDVTVNIETGATAGMESTETDADSGLQMIQTGADGVHLSASPSMAEITALQRQRSLSRDYSPSAKNMFMTDLDTPYHDIRRASMDSLAKRSVLFHKSLVDIHEEEDDDDEEEEEEDSDEKGDAHLSEMDETAFSSVKPSTSTTFSRRSSTNRLRLEKEPVSPLRRLSSMIQYRRREESDKASDTKKDADKPDSEA